MVSDTPFSRYDLVTIEPTDISNIFRLTRESIDNFTQRNLPRDIGFLLALSNTVPFSYDVEYEFTTGFGNVKYLNIQRATYNPELATNDINMTNVWYLLLCYVKSSSCTVVGHDKKYNDGGVEFRISLSKEFKAFAEEFKRVMEIKNNA